MYKKLYKPHLIKKSIFNTAAMFQRWKLQYEDKEGFTSQITALG